MKPALIALVIAGIAATSAGSYWIGRKQAETGVLPTATVATAPTSPSGAERKVLYYRDPMGKPEYSPTPKKDAMGMDYLPVFDEDAVPAKAQATQAPKSKGPILYYRNPMGLADTSRVPKKDAMGMDYVPVYEGDGSDGGIVSLGPEKVQKLGVRSALAERRELTRTIRAVGTIQADERRLFVVNAKFEGWIEKLHVARTGEAVKRGEPLMEIYAPELVAAEQEYLLAWRSLQQMAGAGAEERKAARELADAALLRLRNWDIAEDQIKRLQRSGAVTRTLTLRAPADGVVMEKPAVEGMRFMPGEPLYRIADLSTVWLLADVYEQDLAVVRPGEKAKATIAAYPGEAFEGTATFVYPTLAKETRTAKVRIEIANPDGRLKTDMFATVELTAPMAPAAVVVVPESAVLDSGTRQMVLVDRGAGRFEPREVKLGARADGFYEIRRGVQPGESVVVGANFLIDAESNIKAALGAFAVTAPEGAAR